MGLRLKANRTSFSFLVCTLVLVMLLCQPSLRFAYADGVPDTITVHRVETLPDLITNHAYGFTFYATEDGIRVYSLDLKWDATRSDQVMRLTSQYDAGLQYILEHGYPNTAITGNSDADKYITQAAIWWYMDEESLSDEFRNASSNTDTAGLIPSHIIPLVKGARQAVLDDDSKGAGSHIFAIENTNDTGFTLSDDGLYYESALCSITLISARSYEVLLPDWIVNTYLDEIIKPFSLNSTGVM